MGRKWCLNCEQFVEPKKSVNWVVLILFFGFYILYYALFKKSRCPICNGTNFTETNPKTAKKLE